MQNQRPTATLQLVAITLLAVAVAQSSTAAADALLDLKRQQLRQAESDDLFFWERYLRRLYNPAEFPQPPSFYVPSALIEGQVSAPLELAPSNAGVVPEQHWRAAVDWARSRGTEVLVVARGRRIERAYWGERADRGTLLPVRSIAKSLVALAVGAAIEEGLIAGVDAEIGTYLVSWRDDPRGRITIEQLLVMTSGLDTTPEDRSPLGLGLQLSDGSDAYATALRSPLKGTPGKTYRWGHVESQLLAMVIEQASGMTYQRFLETRIWKPMGLGTASLNVDRKGQARAFCCLRILADDLLKIGLMLMNGGVWEGRQIVSREWVQRMFAPSAVNAYQGYQTYIGWAASEARRAEPPLIYRNDVPFAEPAWYLTGVAGTTTLWMLPCRGIAILRWGSDPPEWETSAIANLLLTSGTDPREGRALSRRPRAVESAAWNPVCRNRAN
jgi:CubicO group peptidase (beta-lactamase class C family)